MRSSLMAVVIAFGAVGGTADSRAQMPQPGLAAPCYCGRCAPCLARHGCAGPPRPKFFNHLDRLTGHLHRWCPGKHECATEGVPAQLPIQPPYPKFHPVPTRPVFEPRAEYTAAQPLNVQLVPFGSAAGGSGVPHPGKSVVPQPSGLRDQDRDVEGPELLPAPKRSPPHPLDPLEEDSPPSPPPPPKPGLTKA